MSSDTGVFYIATGERFVREAEASATSLRKQMPGLPVALASDCETNSSIFDIQIPVSDPHHNWVDKVKILRLSPFQRTLFLDTDTTVLAPFGDLFVLLDRFEVGVAFEPGRYLGPLEGVPDYFPEFNTGVLLFNASPAVFAMFDRWLELYEAELRAQRAAKQPLHHDQPSFTQALYESRISFFVLPPEWNFRAIFPQFAGGLVRIFHGRLKRTSSDLRFVNKSIFPRVLSPNPRRLPGILSDTIRLFCTLYR